MDKIPLERTVMFVGDYFTLATTVVLSDELRGEGETDNDLARRVAGAWIKEFYGWDVASVSNHIGVMEDTDDEEYIEEFED